MNQLKLIILVTTSEYKNSPVLTDLLIQAYETLLTIGY